MTILGPSLNPKSSFLGSSMLKKFLTDLETANPWHFVWIAVITSELLTAVFNAAQSYLWWGRISRDLLMIGALDALFVPLLVAPAAIYFVRNTSRLEKMNEQLKREIEDRNKAQAAMALSKARYRAMIEAYDGLVYICSPDYRIEFMNERLKKRTGYDATGDFCYKALHGLDSVCSWCVNEKVLAGETVRWEVQSPKDNRWYHVTNTPIFNADGTRSKQAMIMDITDRKNMEEELLNAKKLESVGLLAGGIAHDFNNLLAGILSNIELAKMQSVMEGSTYDRLNEAELAAYRAKDLTLQLLTFAKGGAPLKATLVLTDIIKESATLALRGRTVKAEYCLATDLWPVEADAGQLNQVISNMIINADQAMPGGGTISIGSENVVLGPADVPSLREGKYVIVSIKDHGIGILPEHLSRVFDPYFTTKQRGSGLGLATSYSIVKKHQGTITVESEPGEGSTFRIYLPASENKVTRQQAGKSSELPKGQGRILVMDDDECIRETTRNILLVLGYEVELTRDGAEAIDAYREAREDGRPFDAVIIDLTVPGGMGGKETIGKLIEIDPAVKAIVASGYSNDPVLAEFGNYGFKGAVGKPYRLRDLGETVMKVIHSA